MLEYEFGAFLVLSGVKYVMQPSLVSNYIS